LQPLFTAESAEIKLQLPQKPPDDVLGTFTVRPR